MRACEWLVRRAPSIACAARAWPPASHPLTPPTTPSLPIRLTPSFPQYLERKRSMIKAGTWHSASRTATQYHDVLGFHMGK